MKAIYKHIAFAALALSAAACSQEDDFSPSYLSDPDAVRITAQVGTADVTGGFTRSNPVGTVEEQAKFNTGDQISVTAGAQAPVTYQLGDGGWNPVEETYLKWQTSEMDVTAYYPVVEGASATTFTVPTGYNVSEDIAKADYMTYSGKQTKGDDKSINLTMQRKMVRIVIDEINFNDQFPEDVYSVDGITVHANTIGYVDGKPEAGNISVIAYHESDGFYALLAPTTADADATFLTVTVSDGTTSQELTVKGIPATTAGNSYSFSLTVGKDKATMGTVSVDDWTGATIPGGEATEIHYKYDEETNTYIVRNAEGLQQWNEKVQEVFATAVLKDMGQPVYAEPFPNLTLEADIILTGENNWTPLGGNAITMDEYGFEYESYYNGVIDGKGHTITGLRINSNSQYQGFIGRLDYRATVKNLTFADAVVSGGEYSGIVAGRSQGRIENCHVTSGSLTATVSFAGGIVGRNEGGTVINCTNAATIAVADGAIDVYYVGGIAGQNENYGIIMGCINTGTISSYYLTGGVVGENIEIVVACSNKGEVTGTDDPIGGIIGRNGSLGCQTIGSWTITTTESDTNGNGVGEERGTITGCFSGDVATINSKVSEMNEAIATYNASAAEGKTCPYVWQVGEDGCPTLVVEKSE